MSDGIMGIFGSMLSAKENYEKRKTALKDAFGQKMFGETGWGAYKKYKKAKSDFRSGRGLEQQPRRQQQGQDNYPQGTLSNGSWDQA